jgi:hypothetical protein
MLAMEIKEWIIRYFSLRSASIVASVAGIGNELWVK